jgi:hypothetical protein
LNNALTVTKNSLNNHILQPFIGLEIQKVTYFELNRRDDHPYFFEGFDNFDLGVEIEFSNWSYWHIGWKDNDCPELGLGKYDYSHYHENAHWVDASKRWSEHLNSPIVDIELIYVSEEWKIPAKCTLRFQNRRTLTIVIGEELNLDRTIPYPLSYHEASEFYVFFTLDDVPSIELVRIEQPSEYFEAKRKKLPEENYERIEDYKGDKSAWNTIVIFIVLIGVLYLIFTFLSAQ